MSPGPIRPAELDAVIDDLLVGRPLARGRRMLGIEVEHLILHRATRVSAPLPFCRELLEQLAIDFGGCTIRDGEVLAKIRADGFGLSMEPGGQIEIDTEPMPRLEVLDQRFGEVLAHVTSRLAGSDYELAALGHAPVTKVADLGLLPRERYRIMDAEMVTRGPLSRSMMRATAGFQLAYDFSDRADAGRKLALLYRLSPLLMSLTANSREVEGRDSGYASWRHKVWWETDLERAGVPLGCLDAETAISGYVDYAKRAIALFRHDGDSVVATPRASLAELVEAGGVTLADVDLHLSSLFPFVRIRNYIELRCFDAVDWELARSVLALVSGIVYCDKATAAAEALSDEFAVRDPHALRAFHLEAARLGLGASTPAGTAFREVALELIDSSSATLGGTDCDWARIEDLQRIRTRVDA